MLAAMSAYRDELEALKLRIDELEAELRELRRQKDERDMRMMRGDYDTVALNRWMYRLGRKVGAKLHRMRMRRHENELEGARARLTWLEARIRKPID